MIEAEFTSITKGRFTYLGPKSYATRTQGRRITYFTNISVTGEGIRFSDARRFKVVFLDPFPIIYLKWMKSGYGRCLYIYLFFFFCRFGACICMCLIIEHQVVGAAGTVANTSHK